MRQPLSFPLGSRSQYGSLEQGYHPEFTASSEILEHGSEWVETTMEKTGHERQGTAWKRGTELSQSGRTRSSSRWNRC